MFTDPVNFTRKQTQYHKETEQFDNKMPQEEIGSKEPREEIHLEIKPFNEETKAELHNPVTFNHIDNGSQLPIKLETFPKQLLGLPIYDLGPRENEKVNSREILYNKYIFTRTFQTFCAVSSRFKKLFLHRFSASSSLFLFPPWSIVRLDRFWLSSLEDLLFSGQANCGVHLSQSVFQPAHHVDNLYQLCLPRSQRTCPRSGVSIFW